MNTALSQPLINTGYGLPPFSLPHVTKMFIGGVFCFWESGGSGDCVEALKKGWNLQLWILADLFLVC